MEYDPTFTTVMYDRNKYRVPLYVSSTEDHYVLNLADRCYRYFTSKTLPRQVKALLAMIHAFPESVRMAKFSDGTPATGVQRYICPDERLADIGWQINPELYVLILTDDTVERLYLTAQGHG